MRSPYFGRIIRDWEKNGAVARAAKIQATVMMGTLFIGLLVFVSVPDWLKALVGAIELSVLAFLWTRPEPVQRLR